MSPDKFEWITLLSEIFAGRKFRDCQKPRFFSFSWN